MAKDITSHINIQVAAAAFVVLLFCFVFYPVISSVHGKALGINVKIYPFQTQEQSEWVEILCVFGSQPSC